MPRPFLSILVAVARVVAAWAIAACVAGGAAAQQMHEVRTGFEDAAIPEEFVACHRPESSIAISTDRARSGRRSLSLAIDAQPLFPPLEAVAWSPSPRSCLLPNRLDAYRSDEFKAEMTARDPVNTFAKRLTDEGILNESDIAGIQQAMYDEVEAAIQFAIDSPYPEPETALEDVFAERTVTL